MCLVTYQLVDDPSQRPCDAHHYGCSYDSIVAAFVDFSKEVVIAEATHPRLLDQPADIGIQLELSRIADRLEAQRDSLVDDQIRVTRDFAAYEGVPDSELRRSCRRNVLRVVSILKGREELPPGVGEDEHQSGLRRVKQGVPTDQVVEAYRMGLAEMRDAFLREATAEAIGVDAIMLGVRRLWKLVDHFSSALVSARHETELDLARQDERERITFVTAILTGRMHISDLHNECTRWKMTTDGEYWLLRVMALPEEVSALTRHLEHAPTPGRFDTLIAPYGGDIIAILDHCPVKSDVRPALTAAVAGPVRIEEIASAFTDVSENLSVAAQFGLRGLVTATDLKLRLGVSRNIDIGEMLYTKLIEPINEWSATPELMIETVESYLHNHRSIPETAKQLNVHVNTVRYRIERIEQATGNSLNETEVIAEMWWALLYRTIRSTTP